MAKYRLHSKYQLVVMIIHVKTMWVDDIRLYLSSEIKYIFVEKPTNLMITRDRWKLGFTIAEGYYLLFVDTVYFFNKFFFLTGKIPGFCMLCELSKIVKLSYANHGRNTPLTFFFNKMRCEFNFQSLVNSVNGKFLKFNCCTLLPMTRRNKKFLDDRIIFIHIYLSTW